jgi:hypothetical protein
VTYLPSRLEIHMKAVVRNVANIAAILFGLTALSAAVLLFAAVR